MNGNSGNDNHNDNGKQRKEPEKDETEMEQQEQQTSHKKPKLSRLHTSPGHHTPPKELLGVKRSKARGPHTSRLPVANDYLKVSPMATDESLSTQVQAPSPPGHGTTSEASNDNSATTGDNAKAASPTDESLSSQVQAPSPPGHGTTSDASNDYSATTATIAKPAAAAPPPPPPTATSSTTDKVEESLTKFGGTPTPLGDGTTSAPTATATTASATTTSAFTTSAASTHTDTGSLSVSPSTSLLSGSGGAPADANEMPTALQNSTSKSVLPTLIETPQKGGRNSLSSLEESPATPSESPARKRQASAANGGKDNEARPTESFGATAVQGKKNEARPATSAANEGKDDEARPTESFDATAVQGKENEAGPTASAANEGKDDEARPTASAANGGKDNEGSSTATTVQGKENIPNKSQDGASVGDDVQPRHQGEEQVDDESFGQGGGWDGDDDAPMDEDKEEEAKQPGLDQQGEIRVDAPMDEDKEEEAKQPGLDQQGEIRVDAPMDEDKEEEAKQPGLDQQGEIRVDDPTDEDKEEEAKRQAQQGEIRVDALGEDDSEQGGGDIEMSEEAKQKVLDFNYKKSAQPISNKLKSLRTKLSKLRKKKNFSEDSKEFKLVVAQIKRFKLIKISLPEWETLYAQSDKDYKLQLVYCKINMLEQALKHGPDDDFQKELDKMMDLKARLKRDGEIERPTASSHPESLARTLKRATPIPDPADGSGDLFHVHFTGQASVLSGTNCVAAAMNDAVGIKYYFAANAFASAVGQKNMPPMKCLELASSVLRRMKDCPYSLRNIFGNGHESIPGMTTLPEVMKYPRGTFLAGVVCNERKKNTSNHVIMINKSSIPPYWTDGCGERSGFEITEEDLRLSDQEWNNKLAARGYDRLEKLYIMKVNEKVVKNGDVPHFVGPQNPHYKDPDA